MAYTVADYAFAPLTVAPGQEVEVVDSDAEAHTLTAIDGSFDTGSFDNSSPGTFTAPDKPGTYDFVCEIHPSMTGTLTVQ
ncbi:MULTISPECIES: cupredoxin domain-containing protein [Actinomycetes]|uniref:cupredoxin domain-containing protein n=1 Tax=Actinomycetes TaxID=1760 RepID=UPI000AE8220E|nr:MULTISPECIES: cupredoxin domain-containing protein [Actinomycetes]